MKDDHKRQTEIVEVSAPKSTTAMTDRTSVEDLLRQTRARSESVLSKQAEDRLREYEQVVEGLEEMIVVVDRDYRYLIANRAFLNYRDLKKDQVIGHSLSEYMDPANFQIIKQKLNECFQGQVVRYELPFLYPNLGERDLSLSYFPIEGPTGVDRAACVLRDITEQKRAEKAVRKAEQKYRDIFENASEGIFQTTPEGEYIEANPVLARMHGFDSPEELVLSRKDISGEVYVDPLEREEFKRRIEAQGFVRGFEHQIFRRDGTKIWVSVNARAVRDQQGKVLYYEGTSQDINERKLAEARSAAFATLARKLSGATTNLAAARIIAETAWELFGWDSCNIDLYDADRDLVLPMLKVDTIEGRRVDITDSLPAQKPTAKSRQVIDHGPVVLLREDPIEFDRDAVPFGDTCKPSASIMTVPIRHAPTVVGLLSIQSYTPRAYDAAALNDLQSLADHCGEALNRIHAEESFYESEERFRQMAHQFEDVVWLTDKNVSKILYINPAYERIFRRTCESLYERLPSALETIHPEDRAAVERLIDRQRQGHHDPIEYRIIWPDGSVRWIHRRSFPIRNTEGEIYLLAGIAQDVTERKRAQEALRESEERYRDLVENSREFICTHDLDGLILSANRAAVEVLGYDPKEFEGRKSLRDLLVPEVRDQFDDYLARIRRDGFASGNVLVQTRTGEQRLLEYHNTLRTEGVVTPIVRGMANDITERREAEKALQLSEQKYRDIFSFAPVGICQTLRDGTLITANTALAKMLGYDSVDELLSLQVDSDVYFVAGERDKVIKTYEKRGRAVDLELQWKRKDGSPFWVQLNARTIKSTGGAKEYYEGFVLDITERKRSEVALRESEKKYRDLVETAHDLIWAVDAQGTITFLNQASRNVYGYEPEELIGSSYFDLLSPEERIRQVDILPRLLASGEKHVIGSECEVLDRDGNRHVLLANAVIRFDQDGNAIGSMGTSADITERKRDEEFLKLFRNLLDQSSDAIEVIDPITLRFLDCNESAHRSLGYTREEFLALTVFDIDPVVDRSSIARHDEEMKESGFATLESVHRRKDGTTFPVEINVKLVRLEKLYRLAVVRDITGRKRAQEALRESEERYRELFENAKDAIYVHDLSGRYVSVNRAAESLSGFAREEILGKHYSNFVAPSNLKHARTNLCKKLDDENETIYEVFMITKDRRTVPVEVSSRLIHENGVAVGVQGIVRDITERKRAQEALQTFSRRLIEAQEAERQHIARELHDEIGQILTAVKINLQSIQRLAPDSAWLPPLDESVGIVDEALGRVRELSIELRPSLLDDLGLSAALRWYVDRYAQRTGLRAEVVNGFEEDGRLSRELETACFRIAQEALTNVARHAKASSVSVHLERSREKLLLTISDDGLGFDVEGLFSNASTVAALGLRGMEERALALRGEIEIESALQKGTRIRATFPFMRGN